MAEVVISTLMTQLPFVALLICFLAAPMSTQDSAKPNLSGTWTLDAAKSDFGQYPPPEFIILVIEHNEPVVKITTTTKSGTGESTGEQNLTTNGTQTVNKMQVMGAQQEVLVVGKWDGETLGTSWSLSARGVTLSFSDSWSLADDGKVHDDDSRGEDTTRRLYGQDGLQQAIAQPSTSPRASVRGRARRVPAANHA